MCARRCSGPGCGLTSGVPAVHERLLTAAIMLGHIGPTRGRASNRRRRDWARLAEAGSSPYDD